MQKFFDCGIDLGTTNSCIAYPVDGNKSCIIDNIADLMQVTPSAVACVVSKKGPRYLIGRRALNADNVLTCFKRKMGTDEKLTFAKTSISMSPEELSAEVLKRLKSDAESRLGKTVNDVVITVPAAFSSLQNEATKNAAKMADFREVVLLQEPIAAAIAYGVKPDMKDQYWMVFDYGGGTLDVSILSSHDGRLTVINSEGDNYCGGSDIDRLIYDNYLFKAISEEYDIEGNEEVASKLRGLCEQCKIKLSSSEETVIEVMDVEDNNGELIECECVVTRAQLESLIVDTVDHCIGIAKKALEGALKEEPSCKIDKILLVGGSTYIPLVKKKLTEEFGIEFNSDINPMTVVAEGAAIFAGTCTADIADESDNLTDGAISVSLQYEPVAAGDTCNIIGTVASDGIELGQVKIEARNDESVLWTSGWVDFLDEEMGIFDIDAHLLIKNGSNKFVVTVSDKAGKEYVVQGGNFEIKHSEHSLKMAAPPATMSVCVLIDDGNNNVLVPVIGKNSPLPAEITKTFRTTKELNPDVEDTIDIHIYEGDILDNPLANQWVQCIHIQSTAMRHIVPIDTEIEITIRQDESRTNYFTGYIPSLDYVIPEQTLRNTDEKVSVVDRLEEVEKQFAQLKTSLSKLKHNDIDVEDFEDALDSLRNEFDDVYDAAETDSDKAQLFIKRFYELHTAILKKERDFDRTNKLSNDNDSVSQCKDDVERYGDYSQKKAFEKLENSYHSETNPDNQKYYMDEMTKLRFEVITNSFEWLSGFGAFLVSGDHIVFSDQQKADYWKVQLAQGYNAKNVEQLKNAVFQLLNLTASSSNDAINAFRADLRL